MQGMFKLTRCMRVPLTSMTMTWLPLEGLSLSHDERRARVRTMNMILAWSGLNFAWKPYVDRVGSKPTCVCPR